jgi:hypothetical protein
MRQATQIVVLYMLLALLSGCDELRSRLDVNTRNEQHSNATPTAGDASARPADQRFIFPPQSTTFPDSSVALDTRTGQLCKTYSWADAQNAPRGLPLCAQLANPAIASLIGGTKAYRGYTYTFDGKRWNKGREAFNVPDLNANPQPLSEDQYDPLGLFSKGEKAKRLLTKEEIQRVAEEFSVSYEQAWEEAKAQGYQVPPNH